MNLLKLDLSGSELVQKITDSNAVKSAENWIMEQSQTIKNNFKELITDTFKSSAKAAA